MGKRVKDERVLFYFLTLCERSYPLSLSLSPILSCIRTILNVIFLTEILYKVSTSAVRKAIIFLVSSVSPHRLPQPCPDVIAVY